MFADALQFAGSPAPVALSQTAVVAVALKPIATPKVRASETKQWQTHNRKSQFLSGGLGLRQERPTSFSALLGIEGRRPWSCCAGWSRSTPSERRQTNEHEYNCGKQPAVQHHNTCTGTSLCGCSLTVKISSSKSTKHKHHQRKENRIFSQSGSSSRVCLLCDRLAQNLERTPKW